MTANEYKFGVLLFCKTFEGKKYSEIVKECCYYDFNLLINCNISHHNISNSLKTIISHSFVLWYDCILGSLNIFNETHEDNRYMNLKDFLNHFKIPFKDIV